VSEMKRIIAAVLTVLCLLPLLTACKTEEQLGISYDPIVCRFSVGGGFGNIYDTMGYDITVYADNHIEVHSGTMEYYSGLGFSEYSVDVPITEEQKQELISLIKKHRAWNIGDTSNYNVLDAGSSGLILFNENGVRVCYSGGYASNSRKIDEIFNLLLAMLPEGITVEVERKAVQIDLWMIEEYSRRNNQADGTE